MFSILFLVIAIFLFITSNIGYDSNAIGPILTILHLVALLGSVICGILAIREINILGKAKETKGIAWVYSFLFLSSFILILFSGILIRWLT